jgi:hypothetical protein
MILQSAADALYRLEDEYLPIRFSSEGRFVSKTLGIAYRLARLIVLDGPLEALHGVARHEVFGHGSRVREAGTEVLGYHIAWPPPYGPGGGSIRFDFDEGGTSAMEYASFIAGGIESGTVAAMLLEERWAMRGMVDFREAMHYSGTILGNAYYIRDRGFFPGHDVQSYVSILYAADRFGDGLDTVRRSALVEYVNPQLYVALYAYLWKYLIRGDAETDVLPLLIRETQIMPVSHVWLAPYGPEIEARLIGARDRRLISAAVRLGTDQRTWSVSTRAVNVVRGEEIEADVQVDLWFQPDPIDGTLREFNLDGSLRAIGGFSAATLRYRTSRMPITLQTLVGIKSRGYTPGEPLGRGIVLRVGIMWRDY